MSFEKKMYEVEEKWEESYFNDDDRRRIEYIKKLIPQDAKSLLDVGCGNGILVNYLNERYKTDFDRICATDRSETSLKKVKGEKVASDINNLPFKDGEFEISTCLEVIEHLPVEVFPQALKELERVSSKYVIISVPFNENLDLSKVPCPECRTEFNPFYHMHTFTEEKLKGLFDNSTLNLVSIHKVEQNRIPYFPMLKKSISKLINPNAFPHTCICPMCGYNEFFKLKKSNSQSPQPSQEPKGLSRFWPHKNQAKWIAAVFKK